MLTAALTLLGGTYLLFFIGVYLRPALIYRTNLRYLLTGRKRVTTGYFKAMYDKGIKDLTSVRLTGRHVISNEYMIDHSNYTDAHFCKGAEPVLFEILNYKTNATVSDVTLIAGEHNFPIMTEDNYGKGRFFILNLPENFADLYKLPLEVIRGINKHLSMGQRVHPAGGSLQSCL